MSPADLMAELGLSAPHDLDKYNRDQPRVPAGHGHESGEFGSGSGNTSTSGAHVQVAFADDSGRFGSGGASQLLSSPDGRVPDRTFVPPAGAPALPLGAVPEAVVGGAVRFLGPVAFVAAMVVPTPNSGGVSEGTLPDMPGIAYHKDGPAGTLRLTTNASDVSVHALSDHGIYIDLLTGQALGRDLGSSMALDKAAVTAAITAAITTGGKREPESGPKAATDEPEVCPAPEEDRGHGAHKRALDYEDDVHARVNPSDPTPRGYAVRVWDPSSGKDIYPDDCFRKHGDLFDGDMKPGDLAEAKGPGYEWAFSQVYGEGVMEKLVNDTRRQLSAADFRGVGLKIYFAEKGAADLVRERFSQDKQLRNVVISHMPPRTGHQ